MNKQNDDQPCLIVQARLPLTDAVRSAAVLEFFRENNVEFQAVVNDTQLAQLLEQLPSRQLAAPADHQLVISRLNKLGESIEALSSIVMEAVLTRTALSAAPAPEPEEPEEPEEPADRPARKSYKIPDGVVPAEPLTYDGVSVTSVRTERYGRLITVAGFSRLLGANKASMGYHLSRHKNACRAMKVVVGKSRWSWAYRLPETLAYLRRSRAGFPVPTDAEAERIVDSWAKPQRRADPVAEEVRKELAPKPVINTSIPPQLSTKDWPKELVDRLDYLREQGLPVYYREAKRGNQLIATINGKTYTVIKKANCLPPAVVKQVNKLLACRLA